jgi:1-aminocyclopropane-1-carboxylate deaminase/D-cysteine desulfhydrase-like pyridoxal-dependent ACC family enzyme
MKHSDPISNRFPQLAGRLERIPLAALPTELRNVDFVYEKRPRRIAIKCDNLSSKLYGGNKVRKLEYLLRPKTSKRIERFATFGTVGSNHALATAVYAKSLGYECTCFLAHQRPVPTIKKILRTHVALGTDVVRYGGGYSKRIQTIRDNLWGRHAWVVPAGGSSWLGTVGFVNAGLELAEQLAANESEVPDLLYVASGTLGTAAGLALGLALANLPTEVQAVRVSHTYIANETVLWRLIRKTAAMLKILDPSIPANLASRCRVCMRHSFFADGYAHSNAETDAAIRTAEDDLGLTLEQTYSGKAMAALLRDLRDNDDNVKRLFWNTYNSAPLPEPESESAFDASALPDEFASYLS